jgi:hypothetical protein
LKDFASAPKEGDKEPQWKTILDAVNNTLSTVLPVMTNNKKPAKNPNLIDIDGEANRLYNKYKDYIPTDQISIDDFKAELQTNPNLEKTLDDIVRKKQQETGVAPKNTVEAPVASNPTEQNVAMEQTEVPLEVPKPKKDEAASGISIG